MEFREAVNVLVSFSNICRAFICHTDQHVAVRNRDTGGMLDASQDVVLRKLYQPLEEGVLQFVSTDLMLHAQAQTVHALQDEGKTIRTTELLLAEQLPCLQNFIAGHVDLGDGALLELQERFLRHAAVF